MFFSPDAIGSAISRRQSSSPISLTAKNGTGSSSSISSNQQHPQSTVVFVPIREVNTDNNSRASTPFSGRDTPVSNGNEEKATSQKGREKGAVAYGAEEHVALLRLVSDDPNSFNSSESSSEWKKIYMEMCKNYYLHWGSPPRSSSTLHGHLVEMYGAFKKGMRNLSLVSGAPKCPKSMLEADDSNLTDYVNSLFSLLISDKKKYQPKNWWSVEIVSLLLSLHLQYAGQFANGEQSLNWLEDKSVEAKSKFEKDQKNREAELALKRKKEEEEQQEAAKNRKMVAESSVMLCSTVGNTLNALVSGRSNDAQIDEKLNVFKKDLLQELDAREKKSEQKLDEKFDAIIRLLRGG
jgi:hypothetical protein